MKKRILTTLLSLSMVLTFVGCSSSGSDTTSDSNDDATTSADVESEDTQDSNGEVDKYTFDDMDNTELVYNMQVGWNLGNQLEASFSGEPDETAWGNPTITQRVDRLRGSGWL
jgi:uncharacterized protein (UPF0333 family)